MKRILVLKTAALGDVLRTTVLLPGLRERYPDAEIVWVTAPAAKELVAGHPAVSRVECVDIRDAAQIEELASHLAAEPWDWVMSFEEDEVLCRLVSGLRTDRLSGAYLDAAGQRAYTDDVEPWFGMGLLAREGRAVADRRKRDNRRTHPEIFPSMLGLSAARPELPLDAERCLRAQQRIAAAGGAVHPWIGLNTGSGARWPTKALDEERVIELIRGLSASLGGASTFVLLGGSGERERNASIVRSVEEQLVGVRLIDTGCDNQLLDFAALVDACDLLISSDSLGMHVAIARRVPTVAFFAPTSAAEIDLFGLGHKVVSTAADYCSYRRDADNSTITAERLVEAALTTLREQANRSPR